MSLLTYVLLSGLASGASGSFTPSLLSDLTFACALTQLCEILGIRAGYYVMQAPVSWLDLTAFTGYKYVGLSLNMLFGTMFGYRSYNVSLLWTSSAILWFTLKTFANNVPRTVAAEGPKREIMVLAFAASQAVTMWWLGNTKHLD